MSKFELEVTRTTTHTTTIVVEADTEEEAFERFEDDPEAAVLSHPEDEWDLDDVEYDYVGIVSPAED